MSIEIKIPGVRRFIISGVSKHTELCYSIDSFENASVCEIRLHSTSGEKLDLSGFKATVSITPGDIAGRFYPRSKQFDKAVHNAWEAPIHTSYMYGAPVFSYFRSDDMNRFTAAISDSFTSWKFSSGLDDRTKGLEHIFTPTSVDSNEYSFKVLIDVCERPYYESLRVVRKWWADEHYVPAVPESAYDPVYSTWYAWQREVFADTVIDECRMAYELGCKTVFLDDGWATPIGTDAYRDTGDWMPNAKRFPDMKAFVDGVHEIGMKAVLWIAPGLAGVNSKATKKFEGKFLEKCGDSHYILDPRYPEIRKALCEDLVRTVKDYGFDGLKIDFIDSIRGEDKPLADGRDHISVSEGLKVMVSDFYTKLTEAAPDLLIEYRQNYTGPDVMETGNILRSTDCPQDYITNRVNTVDLRLHTNAAVHADMIQFNENEPVEISALQLTNILFSTPQISVRFGVISEEQKKMLSFWLGFMDEKRELLQKSSLEPKRCDANYSQIHVANEREQLYALYSERLLILDDARSTTYIVNAVDRGLTYIVSNDAFEGEYDILDCMGNITESGRTKFSDIAASVKIPFNGMMIIRR